MKCKNCNRKISPDSKFCEYCGSSFSSDKSKLHFSGNQEFNDKVKDTYFSRLFSGRLNRRNLIIGTLFLYLIFLFFLIFPVFGMDLTGSNLSTTETIFLLILYGGFTFYGLSLSIRRLHDIGKSGWYISLSVIPLLNFILIYWLYLKQGEQINEYGGPPTPKIDIEQIFGLRN